MLINKKDITCHRIKVLKEDGNGKYLTVERLNQTGTQMNQIKLRD